MCEIIPLDDFRATVTARRTREAMIAGPCVYGLRRGDRVTVHSTGRAHNVHDFVNGCPVVYIDSIRTVLQPNTYTVL
jgi:hypothetical protein